MASKEQFPNLPDPLIKLNDEAVQELKRLRKGIDQSMALLDDLEGAGLDQTRLRQSVEQNKRILDVLEKHFGK